MISYKRIISIFCFAFLSLIVLAKTKQPDIIIFLADDLGYADVGFNGSDIQTPNIDKIANKGVKLSQFYVCPVCSPTRAGLMTGRYPMRFGMQRSVVPPQRTFGISEHEETLAQILEKAGYKHRGAVGKWHLGHREKRWLPQAKGFNYFVGCYNGAIDYFSLERNGELDWHKNGKPYLQKGYATDLIGDAAIKFIESIPTEEPYFLYVPFNAPHSPFQAKQEDIDQYPNKEGKKQVYAAMIDCMDQNIGRILTAAEKRGNLKNTFILFSSDNGGVDKVGDNSPYRDGKFSTYEGGIRVVAAAQWPKGGIKGGKNITEPMAYIDVFPTLLEAANYTEAPQNKLDGVNKMSVLKGHTAEEYLFFSYLDQNPKHIERMALYKDGWKLVEYRNAADNPKHYSKAELFNLKEDAEEQHNRINDFPQLAIDMKVIMDSIYYERSKNQVPRYKENKKLSGSIIPQWEPEK